MNAGQKGDVQIVMKTTKHSLKHGLHKKEKEIMQVKYKRNISFPDTKKIVEYNHMLVYHKRQIGSNKQKRNKKMNTLSSLKN